MKSIRQGSVDFSALTRAIRGRFSLPLRSLHGPRHWSQVYANACLIARKSGADPIFLRLFALLHDSRREDDGFDPEHGKRGARFARELHGRSFHLPRDRLDALVYAIRFHNEGERSTDPDIGACWDADRLDLVRVGMMPDPSYMSTREGRRLAAELQPQRGRRGRQRMRRR